MHRETLVEISARPAGRGDMWVCAWGQENIGAEEAQVMSELLVLQHR